MKTTITETKLNSGATLFIITTEVDKDWAGKKNSVTTQGTAIQERAPEELIAFRNYTLARHDYAMDNLGKDSYDHQH